MCGIAGIVCSKRKLSDKDRKDFEKMLNCIGHRGPDAKGYSELNPQCIIGNRRLSILDLSSSANQPMAFNNKQIVYNGEIYNFLRLKGELKQSGYTFATNSDTEVVIKLYDKYGVDAFAKLKGMYALAIWDGTSKTITLARDPNSIKPIYYSIRNGTLYFGSEIRQFNTTREFKKDKNWLILFLTFGSLPFERSTLEDVQTLKGGHYLEFNGEVKIKSFQPENPTTSNPKELFNTAMKTHIISDAPLGIFLSGGIDSSVITLCARKHKEELTTLSVIWGDGDESRYQEIIRQVIKSDHRSFQLSNDEFAQNYSRFFKAMDQPTVDGINTYFISRAANHAGLKAVLSGIGGDELALGYKHYHQWNTYKALLTMGSAARLLSLNMNLAIKFSFLSTDLLKALKMYLLIRGIFPPSYIEKLTGIPQQETIDILNQVFSSSQYTNTLEDPGMENYNLLETEIYLKGQLLKDADFMGMYNSIEIRVPFLDVDFYKSMLKIDSKTKLNGKVQKQLIVDLADDVPEVIYNRKKQGFMLPFDNWLRQSPEVFMDNTSSFENKELKEKMLSAFLTGKLHWSKLWTLVVADHFLSQS